MWLCVWNGLNTILRLKHDSMSECELVFKILKCRFRSTFSVLLLKHHYFLLAIRHIKRGAIALIMVKSLQDLGHKSWPSKFLYKMEGLSRVILSNSLIIWALFILKLLIQTFEIHSFQAFFPLAFKLTFHKRCRRDHLLANPLVVLAIF